MNAGVFKAVLTIFFIKASYLFDSLVVFMLCTLKECSVYFAALSMSLKGAILAITIAYNCFC